MRSRSTFPSLPKRTKTTPKPPTTSRSTGKSTFNAVAKKQTARKKSNRRASFNAMKTRMTSKTRPTRSITDPMYRIADNY